MNRIIFFVKYPTPGKVKTRLGLEIGYKQAAQIYKKMAEYNFQMLKKEKIPFDIWIKPKNKLNSFKKWFGKENNYLIQRYNDLGNNMFSAFEHCFKNNTQKAVIIGSDCIDISVDLIKKAFKKLDDYDYVIGPGYDGGYYLLGIKKSKFIKDIFFDIEWSSEKVYEQTIEKLKRFKIFNLKKLNDIDTYEDFKSKKRFLGGLI